MLRDTDRKFLQANHTMLTQSELTMVLLLARILPDRFTVFDLASGLIEAKKDVNEFKREL
jgi:hypothetical protein